jgi:hydrogenase nickel incorporation protein HypA/HybF
MHELSIVMSIIEITESEINKAGGGIAEEIELDIGTLSTIEMEAFDFAWQQGVIGTVLEDAELHVNRIEGRAKCLECAIEFHIDNLYDSCPDCGGFFNQIIQGKELKVKTISVVGSQESGVGSRNSLNTILNK